MSILLDVCIFVGWGGVRWDNNVDAALLPCFFLHCTTYVMRRCCYVVLRCSTYVMLRCCSVPLHCSLALYHIRHATLLLVAVIHTSCYAAALFPCTVLLHCSTYVMLRCCYVLKTKDAKYPDCMNQKILQHVRV